jgi:hypothetical protein
MKERRAVERKERRKGDWKYLLYGSLSAVVLGPAVASQGMHGLVVVIIIAFGLWVIGKLVKYAFKKPV